MSKWVFHFSTGLGNLKSPSVSTSIGRWCFELLASLGISCYAQSLGTFPEDLRTWAIAGFVGTVGSGIPVLFRASLESAMLSDAECLWTPPFQPHLIGPQVTEREQDSPKSWQPLLWCAVPKCDLHRAISVRLVPLKMASRLLLHSLQKPQCGLWRSKVECCLNLGWEQEIQTPSHHFLSHVWLYFLTSKLDVLATLDIRSSNILISGA